MGAVDTRLEACGCKVLANPLVFEQTWDYNSCIYSSCIVLQPPEAFAPRHLVPLPVSILMDHSCETQA